jgi:predicted dehydrogenase
MKISPLKTVLIGFGKIAAGYAGDEIMARHFPYATHAQVLRDHPLFDWEAVVDPSEGALRQAATEWQVNCVNASIDDFAADHKPDVAIIATPPDTRLHFIEKLPSLKAVLVEKPLGLSLHDARKFVEICRCRNILLQVNFVRRADERLRALASGGMHDIIGNPQAVFGLYGNGLLNNGSHMVDLVRMLFGEIDSVRALGNIQPFGPNDFHVPFALRMRSGLLVTMNTVSFAFYRENGLDIWGARGRLSILQEGLGIYHYSLSGNRAVGGEKEIASDWLAEIESTIGNALYHMYSNLAAAVTEAKPLWSDGDSALKTSEALHAVLDSARDSQKAVTLP